MALGEDDHRCVGEAEVEIRVSIEHVARRGHVVGPRMCWVTIRRRQVRGARAPCRSRVNLSDQLPSESVSRWASLLSERTRFQG